jgi:diaminopimelate epimerase
MRKFYKLEGAGNDFVFIDDRSMAFPLNDRELIKRLCHRRYGIGADGLVLLRPSTVADCRMIYFNSDGGEAAFCGNALRCTALALRSCGEVKEEFFVETQKGVMRATLKGDHIETSFPTPALLCRFLPFAGKDQSFYVVDTGVPHAVGVVDDISALDVYELGRRIRHHSQLGPEGANVTFAQLLGPEKVSIRTYERGVEGETLSCGSGAVAAAYVASKLQPASRVAVKTRGDDQFEIDTVNWLLRGPARLVYEGVLSH